MKNIVDLVEEQTLNLVIELYDDLYSDLCKADESVWETENLALVLMQDSMETMTDMLNVYAKVEQFEKCINIKRWIDAINTTNFILKHKQLK